jgi:thiol-disulfide isomerase/thioredoxin
VVKGLLWTGRGLLLVGLAGMATIAWRARTAPAPREAYRHEEPAPPLAYAWLDGRPGSLAADFAGRPVVVHVWASWCAPCVRELPGLLAFPVGRVPVVAISVDEDLEALERFLGGQTPPMMARTAPEMARAFGAQRVPTTFVIDADGQLRLRLTGAWDWTRPALQVQVMAAAGLPLPGAGDQSVGRTSRGER